MTGPDSPSAAASAGELTVGEALTLALDHERAGRLAEAEALAAAITGAVPDHSDALALLAVLRLRRRAVGAEALLMRAIAHAGEDAPFFANLGSLLRRADAVGRALAAQALAVTLDPAFAVVWFNLGNGRREAGGLVAAASAYGRAAWLLPHHPEPQRRLAECLLEMGRPAVAADALIGALIAAPDSARIRGLLGDARRALGRTDAALASYRSALALDPDCADALTNLGAALVDAERPGGLAILRRLARLRPDLAVGRLALGESLARAHAPEAVAALRVALALRPDDRRSLRVLGGALFAAAEDTAATLWHRRGAALDGRLVGRVAALQIRPAGERAGEAYHTVFPPRAVVVDTGTAPWGRVEYRLPEAFLTCVDGALVHPGNFAVETAGGVLLLDGLHAYSRRSLELLPHIAHHTADDRVLTDLPQPVHRVEEEAVLLGGDGNFAHGVLDWASRLCVLDRFPSLRDLPVLVSAALRPAVVELFGLLGLPTERLIRVEPGMALSCRRLWVPSLTHDFQYMAPEHLAFLRDRLGLPSFIPGGGGRRLFLTRSAAGYRMLVNEAAVLKGLAAEGFTPFLPDDLSMAEQIRVFAEAEAIVAPIGGGTAAVAFAPPGTAVLELTHQHCVLPQYAILCALLGQRYGQVVGSASRNRGSLAFDWDFTIPVAQVSAILRRLAHPA